MPLRWCMCVCTTPVSVTTNECQCITRCHHYATARIYVCLYARMDPVQAVPLCDSQHICVPVCKNKFCTSNHHCVTASIPVSLYVRTNLQAISSVWQPIYSICVWTCKNYLCTSHHYCVTPSISVSLYVRTNPIQTITTASMSVSLYVRMNIVQAITTMWQPVYLCSCM